MTFTLAQRRDLGTKKGGVRGEQIRMWEGWGSGRASGKKGRQKQMKRDVHEQNYKQLAGRKRCRRWRVHWSVKIKTSGTRSVLQICKLGQWKQARTWAQGTSGKRPVFPLYMTVDILLQLWNNTVQTLAKNREEKTPLFAPLQSIVFSKTTKFASTLRYE